ncbi:MAG: cell division topological specificity factor MinE [Candidatus Eremiobacteraeota bacterium]|nr:cell division topological specificity factor MinE [Candidatus Eremiobacteraeota bacterium]
MVEFFTRIFKKTESDDVGLQAKERLKLVLISDRATVSPHIMQSLKEELIEVISRYMTIDTDSIQMNLERKGKAVALAANIPVVSMKRSNKKKKGGNGVSGEKKIRDNSEVKEKKETPDISGDVIEKSKDQENEKEELAQQNSSLKKTTPTRLKRKPARRRRTRPAAGRRPSRKRSRLRDDL